MGWFSWLRRSSEPDYESVLSALESKIKSRETHLLSIRLRERRANALFITYGLAAWAVYVFLWWLRVLGSRDGVDRAFAGIPIIGGPVVIVCTRRIMRWWYTSKQEKEETTLRALKKQQRDQVEELKRKTGYYSTRNLLEKYDDVIKKNADTRGLPSGNPGSPARPGPPGPNQPPSTPQRVGASLAPAPGGTPIQRSPSGSQQFPLLPPAPSTPVPRTVFDKLADALLGVAGDEGTPNSKYALICAKCFAHNGLVVKEEWDTIQYQCPRCGHFNPRKAPIPRLGRLDAPGQGGSRRRVQSMLVAPSRPSQDEDEATQTPSVDTPREEDETEDEAEEIVLRSSGKEEKLRQRRGKGDAMDVDS